MYETTILESCDACFGGGNDGNDGVCARICGKVRDFHDKVHIVQRRSDRSGFSTLAKSKIFYKPHNYCFFYVKFIKI